MTTKMGAEPWNREDSERDASAGPHYTLVPR